MGELQSQSTHKISSSYTLSFDRSLTRTYRKSANQFYCVIELLVRHKIAHDDGYRETCFFLFGSTEQNRTSSLLFGIKIEFNKSFEIKAEHRSKNKSLALEDDEKLNMKNWPQSEHIHNVSNDLPFFRSLLINLLTIHNNNNQKRNGKSFEQVDTHTKLAIYSISM